jgi:hypothetical protein
VATKATERKVAEQPARPIRPMELVNILSNLEGALRRVLRPERLALALTQARGVWRATTGNGERRQAEILLQLVERAVDRRNDPAPIEAAIRQVKDMMRVAGQLP